MSVRSERSGMYFCGCLWQARLAAADLFIFFAAVMLGPRSVNAVSPQEALKQMEVAEGFEVELVAGEPEIRQPLSITFDTRGRMWVIQYLQYPTPAGLTAVKVDEFL